MSSGTFFGCRGSSTRATTAATHLARSAPASTNSALGNLCARASSREASLPPSSTQTTPARLIPTSITPSEVSANA